MTQGIIVVVFWLLTLGTIMAHTAMVSANKFRNLHTMGLLMVLMVALSGFFATTYSDQTLRVVQYLMP